VADAPRLLNNSTVKVKQRKKEANGKESLLGNEVDQESGKEVERSKSRMDGSKRRKEQVRNWPGGN